MAEWPERIHVLTNTENLSSHWGIQTEGYPNTMNDWVHFELNNYYLELEWWSVHYHISRWARHLDYNNDKRYKEILSTQEEKYLPCKLLLSSRSLYNLVWAFLGYTEGQHPSTLRLLEYLHSNDIFETLRKEEPYIPPPRARTRNGKSKKRQVNKPAPRKIYRSYLKK